MPGLVRAAEPKVCYSRMKAHELCELIRLTSRPDHRVVRLLVVPQVNASDRPLKRILTFEGVRVSKGAVRRLTKTRLATEIRVPREVLDDFVARAQRSRSAFVMPVPGMSLNYATYRR